MVALNKHKPAKDLRAPILTNGTLNDYIVVIDAGSRGSRAYIYGWPSYQYVKDNHIGMNKRMDYGDEQQEDTPIEQTEHEFSEEDSESQIGSTASSDSGSDSNSDANSDSDSDSESKEPTDHYGEKKPVLQHRLPTIVTKTKWNKKIKPGIATYAKSPEKVSEHIDKLLTRISEVIPKSEHFRTPIFLHATAGMRLVETEKREEILQYACAHVQKSGFFIPDCQSHFNVIDGDVEGLYAWLSTNYLMGSFNNPELHDHGKGHSSYGVLDMGGASTQIAFEPNSTESSLHKDQLFSVNLATTGSQKADLNYTVSSTSFLGYGMYEAHEKYLENLDADTDACFPNGYHSKSHNVSGSGNYTECYNQVSQLVDCEGEGCLLANSSLPAIDFDVNKFVGVSGYWDAISNILQIKKSKDLMSYGNAYSYETFSAETLKICNMPWKELHKLNNKDRNRVYDLKDDELAELCFKSTYLLNILHRGLGLPEVDSSLVESNFTHLQVAEKINGLEFSWTLGRALLYASSENTDNSEVKVGYTLPTGQFVKGGEADGFTRPRYRMNDSLNTPGLKGNYLASMLMFMTIGLVILFFFLGRQRRRKLVDRLKERINQFRYKKLPNLNEGDTFELFDLEDGQDDTAGPEEFIIDSDDEDLRIT